MTEPDRWVRVSGYVAMGFDSAIERFADPSIDGVLEAALARAVGLPPSSLQVRGTAPVRVSSSNAYFGLVWRIDRDGRAPRRGTGSIALLRVQSGHDPITEVLVSVRTDEGEARRVATSLHRFVDDLLARLSSLAA